MPVRRILQNAILVAGTFFFVGAWAISSLNRQMVDGYARDFQAQKDLLRFSAIREALNKSLIVGEPIPDALVEALATSPTPYQCCEAERGSVVRNVELLIREAPGRSAAAYRVAESWTKLFRAQLDRIEAERTSLESYVAIRNWLVPSLAMLLLAISLGLAWYRVKNRLIDPVEMLESRASVLMRGGTLPSFEGSQAPSEIMALSETLEILVLSQRELVEKQKNQFEETSRFYDSLEMQSQKLVEMAGNAVFTLDAGGGIRLWNSHMTELFGMSKTRVAKLKFSEEFLSDRSRDLFEEAFSVARRGVVPDRFQCKLNIGARVVDGIYVDLSPQVDSALGVNRILCVLEVASDAALLTDRRGSEDGPQGLPRLFEMTSELKFLEAPKEGAEKSELARQLKALRTAIAWDGAATNSRIIGLIDVVELVTHFVVAKLPSLQEKNIDLTLQEEVQKAEIKGNAGALMEVLGALGDNAAEALIAENVPRKEIAVKIWCEGGFVCVRVLDSGLGFKDEIKDRAFEYFTTTKSLEGHLGLGLPQSKRLVEAMSGTLTIKHAEFGFGPAIEIRLPLAERSEAN